jgi:hypothetical protein
MEIFFGVMIAGASVVLIGLTLALLRNKPE